MDKSDIKRLKDVSIHDMDSELLRLEGLLSSRGFVQPKISFNLHYIWDNLMFVIEAKLDHDANLGRVHKTYSPSIDEPFVTVASELREIIRSLKAPGEIRTENFLKKFSDVISDAETLGLDVTFTDPLKASMKAMTSNLLTNRA